MLLTNVCSCCVLYLMFVVSLLVFLFFKQKTAFYMRISDWSSDVCSSFLSHARDAGQYGLRRLAGGLCLAGRIGCGLRRRRAPLARSLKQVYIDRRTAASQGAALIISAWRLFVMANADATQIGRANV